MPNSPGNLAKFAAILRASSREATHLVAFALFFSHQGAPVYRHTEPEGTIKPFLTIAMAAAFLLCINGGTWAA